LSTSSIRRPPTNVATFALPSNGWTVDDTKGAKYVNKLAPGGLPQDAGSGEGIKTAAVEIAKTVKPTAKSRGEDAAKIDRLGAPPGPGGFTYRMCTKFPNAAGEIVVKDVSDGTVRKPVSP
jgi:hypothetical protein